MKASIEAISYYLPEQQRSNEYLKQSHPEWPIDQIESKTGIKNRHVSGEAEFSTDMAIAVAYQLIDEHNIDKSEIDFILFCTQTPKYLVPTNACLIQSALGLGQNVGALDINQGCSGYVYSLMMAEGLIASNRAKCILLITADTYTKLISDEHRHLKTIFGDGAAATLIRSSEDKGIDSFVYGTNGNEAKSLISKKSGLSGLMSGAIYEADLCMDGSAVFHFTLNTIPKLVRDLLEKSGNSVDDVDLFVFHQANSYMLEHLRNKINIPENKFYLNLENIGNTVSSSIPIALYGAMKNKHWKPGSKVMLVGFGVGLSWSACIVQF